MENQEENFNSVVAVVIGTTGMTEMIVAAEAVNSKRKGINYSI